VIEIVRASTATPDVRTLVGELEAILAASYPPEQRHGLSLEAIFQPHVAFFVATLDRAPAGCGGVALFDGFAEVKRMYVREPVRGRGIAPAILATLEVTARDAGRSVLRLETGTEQRAAIAFYERHGFRRCEVFGDYATKPPHTIATSVFFEKTL
jgi:putative acetyltransferase